MSNKKIYGVPLVMALRIDKLVADCNILVIEEVLARMDKKMQQIEWRTFYGVNEDWHKHHKTGGLYDRGCGCIYCIAISRYVQTKVAAHRLKRRIDDDYMYNPHDFPEQLKQLSQLEKEWPRLREIKEEVRKLVGL